MRIVGIDPGHARIGYAALDTEGGRFSVLAMGVWEIPRSALSERLSVLEREISSFLATVKPDRIAVERLFFAANRKTAMAVAEARGVIILASGKTGAPIIELAPNEVKRAVTGDGSASKRAVAKMARWIAGLPEARSLDDATDALAIAIASSGRVPSGDARPKRG